MSKDQRTSEFDGLLRLVRRKGAIVHLRDNPGDAVKKSTCAEMIAEDMAIFSTGARSMINRMHTCLMKAVTICERGEKRPNEGKCDEGWLAWLLLFCIRTLQSIYDSLFAWENVPCAEIPVNSSESLSSYQNAAAEKLSVSQVSDRDALSDRIIESMIVYSPSGEKKEQFKDEIRVIGPRALTIMSNFAVKIVIIGDDHVYSRVLVGNKPLSWKGRKLYGKYDMDSCGGLYIGEQRLLLVKESLVGGGFSSVAVHECAHAIDHAIKENHRLSMSLSVRLWNYFQCDRKALVSSYAGENPAEYFAESVEAYFNPVKRDLLIECDPKMFSFLTDLFAA